MVTLKDASGNIATAYNGPVTLALGPGFSATLGGTTSVNAVNGVATFTNLSISESGAGYTLVATAGSLPPTTSTPFTITPADAPGNQPRCICRSFVR